ncbi:MaoC family dehydratase [soil metagenome]
MTASLPSVVFRSIEAAEPYVGQELGVSDWYHVTQQTIDDFAELTNDHEWIHVDVDRAANGPFGGTIAHGLLTLSLIPGFAAQIFSFECPGATVNYGFDRVRFVKPVPCGSKVRGRVTLESLEPHGAGTSIKLVYSVEMQSPAQVVCIAQSLLLVLA